MKQNSNVEENSKNESKLAHVHVRVKESEKEEWEAHLKKQGHSSISQFIRVAVKDLIEKENTKSNIMMDQIHEDMVNFAREIVQVLKDELLTEISSLRMK